MERCWKKDTPTFRLYCTCFWLKWLSHCSVATLGHLGPHIFTDLPNFSLSVEKTMQNFVQVRRCAAGITNATATTVDVHSCVSIRMIATTARVVMVMSWHQPPTTVQVYRFRQRTFIVVLFYQTRQFLVIGNHMYPKEISLLLYSIF